MRTHIHPSLLAALLGVVFTAELHAQGTAITDRGQLAENAGPATDLR